MNDVDYCMDQAADAKDDKTSSHQKNSAALNIVASNSYAAGPERPICNQKTYKPDQDFFNTMVVEQERPG